MNDEKLMFDINEYLLKEYDCIFTVEALTEVLEIINTHRESDFISALNEQDKKTRRICAENIWIESRHWPRIADTDMISVHAAQDACIGESK